jgi:pimeloyl-ACP methyl ester carboxylesterase
LTEQIVEFKSDGLTLRGAVRLPKNLAAGERRPAMIVLHGFGTSREAQNVLQPCNILSDLGYVTFRFDMRGCGESEGRRGNIICLQQVEDTRNAVTFLQSHSSVLPERIAVVGSSFGAAVALYTAGIDTRIAGVISSGGWGNGERKFRGQHATPEAWMRFTRMLEEGRRHRETTGESPMVDRDMIVPVPAHLRKHLASNSLDQFTVDTAQTMYDFRAEEVVGKIGPRPLLLMHSSVDSVTPTAESIELFGRANQPKDLHLFAETDHFMLAEGNHRVIHLVRDWLDQYFPLETEGQTAQKKAAGSR